MKSIKYFLIGVMFICFAVLTSANISGIEFFDKYQQYANNYDEKLLDLYSPDVKVIREVIKSDGTTQQVYIPSRRFFRELKIGQKTARIRRYKNKYRNIEATQIPNGVKISAQRQPKGETYWLDMYQIIENTPSGMKITEEMMQTKVQIFLRGQEKE